MWRHLYGNFTGASVKRTVRARPAEAEVLHRSAEVVREQPVGEHSLVDFSHLPRTGNHTTAVDDAAEPEGLDVLGNEQLGGELRRPVRGSRTVERKRLRNACRARPGGAARRRDLFRAVISPLRARWL